MARGQVSKATATETILKAFPGSFVYDKEIRLPFVEEGEEIQLKCVLTCAKTNVMEGNEDALPGELNSNIINFENNSAESTSSHIEPTAEEKKNIKDLMEALGL